MDPQPTQPNNTQIPVNPPPQATQATQEILYSAPPQSKRNYWKAAAILLFFLFLGMSVFAVFTLQQAILPQLSEFQTQTLEPTLSQAENTMNSSSSTLGETWKKTNLTGVEFEYPNGWHVASNWNMSNDSSILVFINPEPIDGSPGDTSQRGVLLTSWSGLQDPQTKYSEQVESTRNTLQPGYIEEKIALPNGNGIHLTGKIAGEYFYNKYYDKFILSIPSPNPNDGINDKIIVLSTMDEKYASQLQHIAESITLPQ